MQSIAKKSTVSCDFFGCCGHFPLFIRTAISIHNPNPLAFGAEKALAKKYFSNFLIFLSQNHKIIVYIFERTFQPIFKQKISASLTRFLCYLFSLGYTAIEDALLQSVEPYFRQFTSQRAFSRNAIAVRNFLIDYSTLIHPCRLDSEILNHLMQVNSAALHAERETNKLPDIPKDYFNKLLEVTLYVIKSNDPEDKKFHYIANTLLLLMQTGLRIGELCALTTDCMHAIDFNGKHLVYLEYTTWKRERGTNVSSKVVTYVNELAEFAINNLISELKGVREKAHTNYLILDPHKDRSYPISGQDFSGKHLKKYYFYIDKYMKTVDLDDGQYPELSRSKVSSCFGNAKYKNKMITHPVTEQYRVRVCTALYESGVSLEYIAKYMGHLSAHMKGYYVRPKTHEQEDTTFSRSVLSKIVSGDIEPLGGKGSLIQKINEFIEANNMLQTLSKQKLIPELDSLKKYIDRDGVDVVLSQYPNLSHIIETLDAIYKEATEWSMNEKSSGN